MAATNGVEHKLPEPQPASYGGQPLQLEGDAASDTSESDMMHPVSAMQGAFEESIRESTEMNEIATQPAERDAQARRTNLLECQSYDDSWIARWKQHPTAKHHPLQKLMAQIVFGMHLLSQQQAKSEQEVIQILQTHVNEVDTFLENTAEDFDTAIADIGDRIHYLKLPMGHMEVFEMMLDDKKFRTQLLEGNEKIEKIIERSTRAMNASLLDVEQGAQANKELGRYMRSIGSSWPQEPRAIWDVFSAMRGNEHGWRRYLRELHSKANSLSRILSHLQRLIGDMSRMAAAASRRNKTQSSTIMPEPKSLVSAAGPRSKFAQEPQPIVTDESSPRPSTSRSSNANKPLPREPQPMVVPTASPIAHSVPLADRYESPRQSPPQPTSPSRISAVSNGIPQRPKTAGEARPADGRASTDELLDFLQKRDPLRSNPNPLRSNPPDEVFGARGSSDALRSLPRSRSQGPDVMLSTIAIKDDSAAVKRSKSQGAFEVHTISSPAPNENAGRPQTAHQILAKPPPEETELDQLLDLASEHREKRAAMQGTGFARRLSKRLKHLPANVEPQPSAAASKRTTSASTTIALIPETPEHPPRQSSKPHLSNPEPTPTSTPTPKPLTLTSIPPLKIPTIPEPTDSAYASLREKGSPPHEFPSELAPTTSATTTTTATETERLQRRESWLAPLPLGFERPVVPPEPLEEPVRPEKVGERGAASVRSLTSSKSKAMSVRNLFRGRGWRKRGSEVAA